MISSRLAHREYSAVKRAMLQGREFVLPALITLTPDSSPQALYAAAHDTSFRGQIRMIHDEPQTVDKALTTPPTAYAVTLNSAVPVADAIRGYYEALHEPTPPIVGVAAQSGPARAFYAAERPRWTRMQRDHIKQLGETIMGAAHVCVIDQMVADGNTVWYAAQLLLAAGAEQVSAIRGQWYYEAMPYELDTQAMTSEHAVFMHEVGQLAAAEAVHI